MRSGTALVIKGELIASEDVMIDGLFEIVVLFASAKHRAGLFQCSKLLFGIDRLIQIKIKLAQIFMGAAMVGIDL